MDKNTEASKINVILESFNRHADPEYHSNLLGLQIEGYKVWRNDLLIRQEELEDDGFFGSLSVEREFRKLDVVELAKSTLEK